MIHSSWCQTWVLILQQLDEALQTEYCVLRHSNRCFTTAICHRQLLSSLPKPSWFMSLFIGQKEAVTAKWAFINLTMPTVSSQSCCCGLIVSNNSSISQRDEKQEVCFSFILWEILTLDAAGRMNLQYSQLHLIVHTQLFLQHLAELLLLVVESIFATSSLRESPDDRISSRPLKHRETTGCTEAVTGEIRLISAVCTLIRTCYTPYRPRWCRLQPGYDHPFSVSDTEQQESREPLTSHRCRSFSAGFSIET